MYDQLKTLISAAKSDISKSKSAIYETRARVCLEHLPQIHKTHFKEASMKGSSSWLTCLPLADYGFVLNKHEFVDAIALRYNMPVDSLPKHCGCGKENDINHSMTCLKGGYVHLRHNQVRDLEAKLLSEVCHDIVTEPVLLPLSGEEFRLASVNRADSARLDVSARGVW